MFSVYGTEQIYFCLILSKSNKKTKITPTRQTYHKSKNSSKLLNFTTGNNYSICKNITLNGIDLHVGTCQLLCTTSFMSRKNFLHVPRVQHFTISQNVLNRTFRTHHQILVSSSTFPLARLRQNNFLILNNVLSLRVSPYRKLPNERNKNEIFLFFLLPPRPVLQLPSARRSFIPLRFSLLKLARLRWHGSIPASGANVLDDDGN